MLHCFVLPSSGSWLITEIQCGRTSLYFNHPPVSCVALTSFFLLQDFGDGGAFPEIHVAQYPLNMGKKKGQSGEIVPLQVDAEGKVRYDTLAKLGQRKDKVCVFM